jgi:hypothetical protein
VAQSSACLADFLIAKNLLNFSPVAENIGASGPLGINSDARLHPGANLALWAGFAFKLAHREPFDWNFSRISFTAIVFD